MPQPRRPSERATGIALVALVAAGLALRLRGIGAFWPNPDEGDYYAIALLPGLGAVLAEIAHHTHPPLVYVIEHALARITTEIGWMRAPSALAGTATIALLYAAGREAGGRVAGLACAALVAFSPASIALSQSLRPYAIAGALVAAGAAAVLAHERRGDRATRLAAGGAFALALAAHYATLVVLPAAAFLLARRARACRERAARREAALAIGAWAALAAALGAFHVVPHLLGEPVQRAAQDGWLADQFPRDLVGLARALVGVERLAVGDALALAACGALVAGAVRAARARGEATARGGNAARGAAVLALGALAAAAAAAALAQLPLGATRHSYLLALVLAPLQGAGVAALHPLRARTAAAALAIVAVSALSAVARPAPPPLAERLATRDAIARAIAPLARAAAAAPEAPGALLALDRQTFRMLAPYFRDAGAEHLRDPAHPAVFTHFDWGALHVVVAQAWALRTNERGVERADHLFGFLLRAHAAPDLALDRPDRRTGWLARGGWNVVDERTGEASPLVVEPLDVRAIVARFQPLARAERARRTAEAHGLPSTSDPDDAPDARGDAPATRGASR